MTRSTISSSCGVKAATRPVCPSAGPSYQTQARVSTNLRLQPGLPDRAAIRTTPTWPPGRFPAWELLCSSLCSADLPAMCIAEPPPGTPRGKLAISAQRLLSTRLDCCTIQYYTILLPFSCAAPSRTTLRVEHQGISQARFLVSRICCTLPALWQVQRLAATRDVLFRRAKRSRSRVVHGWKCNSTVSSLE